MISHDNMHLEYCKVHVHKVWTTLYVRNSSHNTQVTISMESPTLFVPLFFLDTKKYLLSIHTLAFCPSCNVKSSRHMSLTHKVVWHEHGWN